MSAEANVRPRVVRSMVSSVDGKLAADAWSASPDGTNAEWIAAYDRYHAAIDADAWIVGCVTMAEMTDARARAAPRSMRSRSIFGQAAFRSRPAALAPHVRLGSISAEPAGHGAALSRYAVTT